MKRKTPKTIAPVQKKKARATRSRSWCFTINNYTEGDLESLETLFEDLSSVKYLVFGLEHTDSMLVREEQLTPHVQGFIYLRDPVSLATVKRTYLGDRAHCEIKSPYSTFLQASDYCKKEGRYKEYGSLPMDPQRKGDCERERWQDMIQAAKSGSLEDLQENEPQAFVTHYGT